jgi:ABC-type polysaccharide/polyol phosphate export permease
MQGAYRVIANINPVSHLVEGVRGLVIDGFTARHVATALLVPIGIGAFSIALAMRTFYSRLAAR